MSSTSGELLILGVGNPLMCDDGIGVVVARELSGSRISGARFVDAGTAGYGLIEILAESSKTVLIDAVDARSELGSVFWVAPENLELEGRRSSLHQVGLADVIALLGAMNAVPPIHVIGIQPKSIKPAHGLSDELSAKVPSIIQKVDAMLNSLINSDEPEEE